jgi:DNA-binding NarL/FixJ family response regulator
VTVQEDRDYIEVAFSVGARGYVFKSRVATDLIPAVEAALQGNLFTSIFEVETQFSVCVKTSVDKIWS